MLRKLISAGVLGIAALAVPPGVALAQGATPAPAAAPATPPAAAPAPAESEWIPCAKMWDWAAYQCRGTKDSWNSGTPVLYLTGFTYHDRGTYSQEQIDEYNEKSWGGGYGWGRYNEKGDYFGWYGLIFRDSHFKYTKMFGWNWMTYWPARGDVAFGLGYTAFLGSRPDIYSGVPFPGILPLASVKLGKAEIIGTYIPKVSQGTTGNGNVAFVFGRWFF